jgi:DNA-binding transcriptional LysR family regulator
MNNWSDYPILMAVAETGSLTAAGKRLKMSQPTVGRRIRALEDHFGSPLLTKEKGALVPTAFGHSMLDHIRRMSNEAAAIDRSSASLEQSLAGPVIISATEGLGTHWVPFAMQAFRAEHPDLLLDMNIGFETVNLAQREADIALRWMGPGNQNSLIARKVADCGFGMYASRSYVEGRPQPLVSKADLANHDSVVLEGSETGILWPKTDDGTAMPYGRLTFHSNSLAAHINAIIAGYGIGSLPVCLVEPEMELVRLLPNFSHHEGLWLVAHEDLKRSVRVRAVFDFLVDSIQKDRGFFYSGTPSVFGKLENFQCGTTEAKPPIHNHALEKQSA